MRPDTLKDAARGTASPRRSILPAASIGFTFVGLATALLGPLLPALSATWTLDDTEAGALLAARALGCLTGVGAVGMLARRMPIGRMLGVGFAVVAAGSVFTATPSWTVGVAAIFVTGIGLTVATAGTNLYVATSATERPMEALNLINFLWGAGAAAAPLFARLLGRGRIEPPFVVLAAVCAIVTVWTLRGGSEEATPKATPTDAASAAEPPRSRLIWLIGAGIFFYVGAEMAVGGWIGTYALRFPGAPETAGTMATSAFWLALVLGRLGAVPMLRVLRGETLVICVTLVMMGGIALVTTTGSWTGAVAGATVAGLGCATIFPTSFALFARAAGAAAARTAWVIFALANLGAAVVPWLVGVVSDATGELHMGFVVPLAACVCLVVVQIAMARYS